MVRLLDDPATLRAAQDDPAGFVEHNGLMVIDEIHLAPWLFRLPGPAQGVRQDHLQIGVPGHRWVFTAVVPHDQG